MKPTSIDPDTPSEWAGQFQIETGTTYLNHGSFGPSPECVIQSRNEWSRRLERQPMNFFLREMETRLDDACGQLGEFLGADASDLVFVDNATFGMNIVASSTELHAGDEVLMTDHEYGAVMRIWRRACKSAGANLVVAKLPFPLTTADDVVESILERVIDRTRMIVVSHVTSPTAVTLPVAEICRRARALRIPVCVDGPHAVGMLPLNLRAIDCDYYTASCHKWLSGPFGSGFLFVAGRKQQSLKPTLMSWGGSLDGRPTHWKDEYRWIGTRDPAVFLAVPTAIDFLQQCGLEAFRERSHLLARSFRERMTALTGMEPFVPDDADWYGPMAAVPIPPGVGDPPKQGQTDPLQAALWKQHGVEIPIVHWHGHRLLRVSCHLYNTTADVDRLMAALGELL